MGTLPAACPQALRHRHGRGPLSDDRGQGSGVRDQGSGIRTPGEMATHGIKWIFADEGVLRADGSLPAANTLFAGGLVDDVRLARPLSPALATQALAWVQGRDRRGGGNLSLADPSVRARIVATC